MHLMDNILMALTSLKSNLMRTFLTMLGIIIGIASVIAIMTIGNSLSGSMTSQLTSFGINNVTVMVTTKSDSEDSNDNNGMQGRDFARSTMTEDDLISDTMISEFKESYADKVDYILLDSSVGSFTPTNNQNTAYASIDGVNEDYLTYSDLTMITGRFVNEEDQENRRMVALVSDVFVNQLYGCSAAEAIGKTFTVTVNNFERQFYIVGVYEYDNSSTDTDTSETYTSIYIPVKTAQRITFADDGYSSITVVGNSSMTSDSTTFLEEVQQFFAQYYYSNDTYTVSASNMSSMLDTVNEILSTVTVAISCIAAISLIVGGIGVMNIMLVSITERTREIGTRKALGATQQDIRMQFITEAVIICLIGGFIGIVLGLAIGALGAKLLGFETFPSISSIVMSVFFSTAIGIFFGYYPANKAAKMNPIDALRYE